MLSTRQLAETHSGHPGEKLELARELYQEYHGSCFWNSPRDLQIDESHIGFVEKGLRANGDHRAFKLSSKLRDQPR